jgi:O-6-methylguanine DNA methyltransferase
LYSFALPSPIGLLFLAVTERGLRRLHTLSSQHALEGPGFSEVSESSAATGGEAAIAGAVEQQLGEYFDGSRRDFELRLDLDSGSAFQRRVWEVIARIPYGEVASYAEVAQAAGAPGAFRAAGTACGANPVALVTPCHRVIASGNKLGGYGLGIENKVWLLRHEGIGATGARPDARVLLPLSAGGEGVGGRGRLGV